MYLDKFRYIQANTLNTLTKEGTGFFAQGVLHHAQCSFRSLIGVASRLLDMIFMSCLRSITAHIDKIAVLGYISSTVFHAMIFFIVHDVESHLVFIGKDFGAFIKVTAKVLPIKGNETYLHVFRHIQIDLDMR